MILGNFIHMSTKTFGLFYGAQTSFALSPELSQASASSKHGGAHSMSTEHYWFKSVGRRIDPDHHIFFYT
jgi:hypothetical protein